MATRNELVGYIQETAEISHEDAEKVFKAYEAHNLISVYKRTGEHRVKHGSLLDAATILNALSNIEAGEV